MAEKKKRKERPSWMRFRQVDVYKPSFGPIAEGAVYEVFQDTFNIERHNMRKFSFSHCVEQLRRLNPEKHEAYKASIKNKK